MGTNQYPNFNELAGDKRPLDGCKKCGCGGEAHEEEGTLAKLETARAASEFEALRLETENSGKRPKAFMLTIGNLAMRQARAQFSCNFLACVGYQVIDNLGFASVEEGKHRQTSWLSAPAMMNMQNMLSRPSRHSTDALCLS